MKIWIKTLESVKEYEVEDLPEAHDKVVLIGATVGGGVLDWDISSFRAPPDEVEAVEEFKFVKF